MNAAQSLWLMAALQLGLFGLLWWLAALRVPRRAPALRDFGRFNACLALALAGVAAREVLPELLTHAVADVLMLVAVLLLWRGLHRLMRLPPMVRPHALVGVASAAILLTGLADEASAARAAMLLLTMAWLVGHLSLACQAPIARQLGRPAARAMVGLSSGLAALMLARAVTGLWLDWPMEVHVASTGTLVFCLLAIAVLTLLNAVLAAAVLRRVMERMVRQSEHDPDTGLANRQGLERALAQAWSRWGRDRRRFAVMVLAIERFEQDVVAQHGREAADEVLRRVAAVLSHDLRQTDLLARDEGHRLVAVLDGEHRDADLLGVSRRLQSVVAEMRLLPRLPTLRLSLGVGAALVQPGDSQAEGVALRAGMALRAAGPLAAA